MILNLLVLSGLIINGMCATNNTSGPTMEPTIAPTTMPTQSPTLSESILVDSDIIFSVESVQTIQNDLNMQGNYSMGYSDAESDYLDQHARRILLLNNNININRRRLQTTHNVTYNIQIKFILGPDDDMSNRSDVSTVIIWYINNNIDLRNSFTSDVVSQLENTYMIMINTINIIETDVQVIEFEFDKNEKHVPKKRTLTIALTLTFVIIAVFVLIGVFYIKKYHCKHKHVHFDDDVEQGRSNTGAVTDGKSKKSKGFVELNKIKSEEGDCETDKKEDENKDGKTDEKTETNTDDKKDNNTADKTDDKATDHAGNDEKLINLKINVAEH